MAIAFDSSAKAQTQSANPLSWSHTCTGSQLVLIVDVFNSGNNTTSVTYNGTAMTQFVSQSSTINSYYLINPSTGSNTVSVNLSSSGSTVVATSKSYTGVNQTSPIDSFGTGNAGSVYTLTISTTVVASNCWLSGFCWNIKGAGADSFTIASDRTDRQVYNNQTSPYQLFVTSDSNGTVATGSQSFVFTSTPNNTFNSTMRGHAYSIAPYIPPAGTSQMFQLF